MPAPNAPSCLAFGLVQDLLDAGVELAGVDAQLIRQIGNGFFARQVPADNLGFLQWTEVAARARHGRILLKQFPTADNSISSRFKTNPRMPVACRQRPGA
jgi:hypothetical protein